MTDADILAAVEAEYQRALRRGDRAAAASWWDIYGWLSGGMIRGEVDFTSWRALVHASYYQFNSVVEKACLGDKPPSPERRAEAAHHAKALYAVRFSLDRQIDTNAACAEIVARVPRPVAAVARAPSPMVPPPRKAAPVQQGRLI
ncbi:hypothetical protein DXH95_03000 [Sphingorhabdus pulchriflava]|uniref:Uncharacterized protein n=1 Tax=Sphingorhabdus pulchriflava TaxID=2292257 RepID=A0A371BFN1_9SPHN|nr:hypothetical protein [Sphingorhabdus pulchriflava]RDV06409.1 hypothetical protein DXH95_03000 [Sphingorhabdus pulchriflava]